MVTASTGGSRDGSPPGEQLKHMVKRTLPRAHLVGFHCLRQVFLKLSSGFAFNLFYFFCVNLRFLTHQYAKMEYITHQIIIP